MIAIIACCTIFFGSDNEDSAPNNSDPIEEVKFDELSCSTLLSNGDYSYHCSLNSATPAIFSTDPPISEVCYYPIGDTDVFFFYLLTIKLSTTVETANEFIDGLTTYGSGGSNDSNQTTNTISGLGDEAKMFSWTEDDELDQLLIILRESSYYSVYY